MIRWLVAWVVLALVTVGWAQEPTVADLKVVGQFAGENLDVTVTATISGLKAGGELSLVRGDAVLSDATTSADWRLRYAPATHTWFVVAAAEKPLTVTARFAARAGLAVGDGTWREVTMALPEGGLRSLELASTKTDLELDLPGTVRRKSEVRDQQQVTTALLLPGQPLVVRWKPQVETLEAKLLMATEANTILNVSPGAVRNDTLFTCEIAQGKMRELRFAVPKTLTVTQVRGQYIADWRLEEGADGRVLSVKLNREQTSQYLLQVQAETPLPPFPTEFEVPVLKPLDDTRADGFLAIGTGSAIQLQVKKSSGLTQIEGAAFPRIALDREHPRALPGGKSFFYAFAATPYQLQVGLTEVVPSYDVSGMLTIAAKDDDLAITAELELEVRDAAVRFIEVSIPEPFAVAEAGGPGVLDHSLKPGMEVGGVKQQALRLDFRQPVLGRTTVAVRLELGKSPVGQQVTLAGLGVAGARNERGFIVVVAEPGVLIEAPTVTKLRQVHTRSVPMQVAEAQFAWRYGEAGWSLALPIKEKPANIRVEAFHLVSLGEGIAYGNVSLSYVVAGAPVDELRFKVPAALKDVEFVGVDVTRWTQVDGVYTVKLRRKVLGNYNLSATWSQHYDDQTNVLAGGLETVGAETETGYLTIASHLNVDLTPGQSDPALIPISREEIPAELRLLVNAPILTSFKYVSAPHQAAVTVKTYGRGTTPPVLVEFMSAATQLDVTKAREIEARTRLRYTLKNSSAQYLDLAVPKERDIWATRLIRMEKGQERVVPVGASRDEQRGTLKIPLERQRNPNDPITVEVEYGEKLGSLGWGGYVNLVLPACLVHSTFAEWRVSGPPQWAVAPAGGNMGTEQRPPPRLGSLAALGLELAERWVRALANAPVLGVLALVIALPLLAVGRVTRQGVVNAGIVVLLLAVFVYGALAWSEMRVRPLTVLTETAFTQVLDLDAKAPLHVVVTVVPGWRQHVRGATTLAMLAVALIGVALARRRGCGRVLGTVLASFGGLGVLVQIHAFGVLALHVFTWGWPLAALVWFVWTIARRHPAMTATAQALLLGGVLLAASVSSSTSAQNAAEPPKAPAAPVVAAPAAPVAPVKAPVVAKAPAVPVPLLDLVEARCTVEADTVLVELHLAGALAEAQAVPVAPATAVVLTDANTPRLEVRDGQYTIPFAAGARGDYTVRFLCPLPPGDEARQQLFRLLLPPALVSRARLVLPGTGLAVQAPNAIRLQVAEENGKTTADALQEPGADALFVWQPQTRLATQEQTAFYSEITSLLRVDSGLVEGLNYVQLRVAQGELARVGVLVPEPMTVTRVEGDGIGAWRFDPQARRLDVRLARPATGEYALLVVTQISNDTMPYTASIGGLHVAEAARERGTLGLFSAPAVAFTVTAGPQPVNVDDFLRNAAALLARMPELRAEEVRNAYQLPTGKETVTVTATTVAPELRLDENVSFSVADDRLAYSGTLALEITKAGVFYADLALPEGYDIDSLTGPAVSHWDETATPAGRQVRVHFRTRLLGKAPLAVALSRPLAAIPPEILVPHVTVTGALKHTGKLVIAADRGVRLSVLKRDGVSELDVAKTGLAQQPALAFKLLRPDWLVQLQTEVLQPRVNVEFLHLAKVSDGIVRHRHYLRYKLQNAGTKVLELDIPKGALGLNLIGPEIARKENVDPQRNRWRIELSGKWFDRPYPLEVSYELQFDQTAGKIEVAPVQAVGAELQRGYVVVKTTQRVELTNAQPGPTLQPAEARSIPRVFGAESLADAAFCYSSAGAEYTLALQAARHQAAALLDAQVTSTTITSVVSRQGDSIHRVNLVLRAGGKRHLSALLPPQAEVWTLLVDRESRTPSTTLDANQRPILLIPLEQSDSGDRDLNLDLTYVIPAKAGWRAGRQQYWGPQFDLPLHRISWTLYVPEEYYYWGFSGTLTPEEEYVRQTVAAEYSFGKYAADYLSQNREDVEKAKVFQQKGLSLAQKGQQRAARDNLRQAFSYSQSDLDLNEDARVNLHELIRQQAVVGLVQRRATQAPAGAAGEQPQLGEDFTQEQAVRLQSSLNKADSENLDLITRRMIEVQDQAAETGLQLMVNLPQRGRVLVFRREMQVKPNTEMMVSFGAVVVPAWQWMLGWGLALGIGLGFLALLLAVPWLGRRLATPPRPPKPPAAPAPEPPPATSEEPVAAVKLGPELPPAAAPAEAPPANEAPPAEPPKESPA